MSYVALLENGLRSPAGRGTGSSTTQIYSLSFSLPSLSVSWAFNRLNEVRYVQHSSSRRRMSLLIIHAISSIGIYEVI